MKRMMGSVVRRMSIVLCWEEAATNTSDVCQLTLFWGRESNRNLQMMKCPTIGIKL